MPPELSWPVRLDRVPRDGHRFAFAAAAEQLAAVAARLDLAGLDGLAAEGHVVRLGSDQLFKVEGRIEARPIQICVVTLEPFTGELAFAFRRLFSLSDDAPVRELVLDAETLDIEPIAEPTLDLGEVVVEELAVHLDPYPHSPEAAAELAAIQAQEATAPSPFAALAALRQRPH